MSAFGAVTLKPLLEKLGLYSPPYPTFDFRAQDGKQFCLPSVVGELALRCRLRFATDDCF